MASIKYFLYSSEQLKFRREMEERMGRKFNVGQVIVDGVRKPFTELSSTSTSRFSDSKIVAKGDPRYMNYTLPEGK